MTQRPDVSVIVPTYREAENLPRLLPRLLDTFTQADLCGEVLIVDDNSDDGTPEACKPFIETGRVRLMVRKDERGLSSAVLHGIKSASGPIIVVMDADLSHPPEAIPRLVDALEQGADMVLGSRYVAGGSTSDEWTAWRWINSKAACLFALPLTRVRDPMAGFLAIRHDRVLSIWDSLNPVGYKIALELLVKCGCKRVVEIPIRFEDRVHGQSKLNLREQLNYLRHIGRLYHHCIARKINGPPGPG